MVDMVERKVVVVTGGTAGVGRATVRAFAQRGWAVAVLARGRAGLEGTVEAVRQLGVPALACQVDVADWESVDRAATAVENELGPIDVWVNNAMTTVFARFVDVEPAEFRRATEVTYLGQVHGTLAALHRMRPRDRGVVVQVGSALAYVAIPLQSAYCGAKFAARGFTLAVRAELREEGSSIGMPMVDLPAVNTPQFSWCRSRLPDHPHPVPPIYQPELAAARIVDAALDPSHDRVLGSWNQLVIWGGQYAPRVLERFAARTAVEGQQIDAAVDRFPTDNLFEPADEEVDAGAHGVFDDRSGGVMDPAFVRDLPGTVAAAARAAGGALADRAGRLGRRLGVQ